MTITGMSWAETINSLRGVRTLVDPNFAFQKQLKHFYDKLMLQVDRRFDHRIDQNIRLKIFFRNVNDFSLNLVRMI